MVTAKDQFVNWGVPILAGAILCEQPHHWLGVLTLIAVNIVSTHVVAVHKAVGSAREDLAELRREVESLRLD
jgi:hypothetical protein